MSKKVQQDQLALAYRKVRDATMASEKITNAEKVAVLELVKAEIVRFMQSEIDEG